MITTRAENNNLYEAYSTPHFVYWIYKTANHTHNEIAHNMYFTMQRRRLDIGDQILVLDGAMVPKTYMVEGKDEEAQTVELSVFMTHEIKPVMPAGVEMVYRYRGPHGGGHCIVDKDGEVIQGGFQSQAAAKAEIDRYNKDAA